MRPAPFYGWVVVGTGFSVLFMAYGAQFSFGVFFSALPEEFGWSSLRSAPRVEPGLALGVP